MNKPTDWKALIADLESAGLSRQKIVEGADSKLSTIADLATGKSRSPRFHTGVLLLMLHARHVRPTLKRVA